MSQLDYRGFETLNVDIDDNMILTCQIETGHPVNLVNSRLHRELEDFFQRLSTDNRPRVVVLTGNSRAFSAGGDVEEMKSGRLLWEDGPGGLFTRGGIRIVRNLLSVPQPVISAVNGDAIGLGANIALMCDIVVMSEEARIGDPHTRLGLVAGDGGAVIWPLLVGINRAKELLFTGRLLDSDEAFAIGLVNRVVPKESVMDSAMDLARELAEAAPFAQQWTKQAVNKVLWDRTNLILELSLALEGMSAQTADHAEGVEAFSEKRLPRFTGD